MNRHLILILALLLLSACGGDEGIVSALPRLGGPVTELAPSALPDGIRGRGIKFVEVDPAVSSAWENPVKQAKEAFLALDNADRVSCIAGAMRLTVGQADAAGVVRTAVSGNDKTKITITANNGLLTGFEIWTCSNGSPNGYMRGDLQKNPVSFVSEFDDGTIRQLYVITGTLSSSGAWSNKTLKYLTSGASKKYYELQQWKDQIIAATHEESRPISDNTFVSGLDGNAYLSDAETAAKNSMGPSDTLVPYQLYLGGTEQNGTITVWDSSGSPSLADPLITQVTSILGATEATSSAKYDSFKSNGPVYTPWNCQDEGQIDNVSTYLSSAVTAPAGSTFRGFDVSGLTFSNIVDRACQ